jgi:hypothetical protein
LITTESLPCDCNYHNAKLLDQHKPIFTQIPTKFHPLHQLRKLGWYRKLQDVIDPDVVITMRGLKVYLKLLRDLSLILPIMAKEEQRRMRFYSYLLVAQYRCIP